MDSSQDHKDGLKYTKQCVIYRTHKRKYENHMVISTNKRKAFDEIQHLFMIKTLTKVGIRGTYLKVTKAIYDKSIAKSTFNGEKLKSLPAKT